MTTKKSSSLLAVRVPLDLSEATKKAAKDAGMPLADYVRFALRQAVDRQSAAAEMAGIEERMAASMTKMQRRLGRIEQAQQFQFAALDQFMKMALSLEPEYTDEASRVAAGVIGRTRYKKLIESVPGALDSPLSQLFQAAVDQADK